MGETINEWAKLFVDADNKRDTTTCSFLANNRTALEQMNSNVVGALSVYLVTLGTATSLNAGLISDTARRTSSRHDVRSAYQPGFQKM